MKKIAAGIIIVLAILALALVVATYVVYQNVDSFSYSSSKFDSQSVSFHNLSLQTTKPIPISATLPVLKITRNQFYIAAITADSLTLTIDELSDSDNGEAITALPAIPTYLPNISITNAQISLPCEEQLCTFTGGLNLKDEGEVYSLNINASALSHPDLPTVQATAELNKKSRNLLLDVTAKSLTLPPKLQQSGLDIDAVELQLRSTLPDTLAQNRHHIAFTATTQGVSQVSISGTATVNSDTLSTELHKTSLQVKQARLLFNESTTLNHLNAGLTIEGKLNQHSAAITANQLLLAFEASTADNTAHQLQLKMPSFSIAADLPQSHLQASLALAELSAITVNEDRKAETQLNSVLSDWIIELNDAQNWLAQGTLSSTLGHLKEETSHSLLAFNGTLKLKAALSKLLGSIELEPTLIPPTAKAMGINIERALLQLEGALPSVATPVVPLVITAQTQGLSKLNISAQLSMDAAKQQLKLERSEVSFSQADLKPTSDVSLSNISGSLKAAGEFNSQKLAIQISDTAIALNASGLDMEANGLVINAPALNIGYDLADSKGLLSADKMDVHTALKHPMVSTQKASLTLNKVIAPIGANEQQLNAAITTSLKLLKTDYTYPLDWTLNGTLSGNSQAQEVIFSGTAENSAYLSVDIGLTARPSNISGTATLRDVYFLAGNPIALTALSWPILASVNRGKMSSDVSFTLGLSDDVDTQIKGHIKLAGVNGIYDLTQLNGIDLKANLESDGKTLSVTSPSFALKELDNGVQIGPLSASGTYKANMAELTAGRLAWQNIQLDAFGGTVVLPTGEWQVNEPLATDLTINNIDLATILAQYPNQDIEGSGTLAGKIPLRVNGSQINVDAGNLRSGSEGGVLRYRSADAKALASSNAAMDVVVKALDDFHYELLNADVSYDPSGKLLLGVKLKGHNPELESGRAVNFNINIEEDLPALLTSLQLSGQVNDLIKQRINDRINPQSGSKQ